MHKYHVIEKGESLDKASGALVLLHGRGATAYDMLPLSYELVDHTFYVAAPQATQNRWYPESFLADEQMNEPWLSSAIDYVQEVVQNISRVIPKEKIFVMGFSQGACLALEAFARRAERLGGLAAFTGGLIGKELKRERYQGDFQGMPLFMGNSDKDPHVPLARSEESKRIVESLGAKVIYKVYPGMSHTINDDEIFTVKEKILLY